MSAPHRDENKCNAEESLGGINLWGTTNHYRLVAIGPWSKLFWLTMGLCHRIPWKMSSIYALNIAQSISASIRNSSWKAVCRDFRRESSQAVMAAATMTNPGRAHDYPGLQRRLLSRYEWTSNLQHMPIKVSDKAQCLSAGQSWFYMIGTQPYLPSCPVY